MNALRVLYLGEYILENNGRKRNATIAQLVERRTCNADVVGSSPTCSFLIYLDSSGGLLLTPLVNRLYAKGDYNKCLMTH